jgi:hypothetical protein
MELLTSNLKNEFDMKTSKQLVVQNANRKLFLGYLANQSNDNHVSNKIGIDLNASDPNDTAAEFGKWSEKDFKKEQSGYDLEDEGLPSDNNVAQSENDDDVIY